MKLTLEQIQEHTIGAFDVLDEDGLVRMYRLPESMRAIYAESEGSDTRACSPSGIRLRFLTDATSATIALQFRRAARAIYQSAMVGALGESISFGPEDKTDQWKGNLDLTAAPEFNGKRLVDIWWPHMAECLIESVELHEGELVEAAPSLPISWLVYGDSITQGMTGTLPTETNIATAARAINAQINNLAIGGAVCDPRLATCVPDGEYDLVSIAYGTNDYNKLIPIDTYVNDTNTLIDAIQAKHADATILVITPPPWIDEDPSDKLAPIEDYRQALADSVAERKSVIAVQGTELMPSEQKYFVDKVHPNDLGMKTYGEALLPYIKRALEM